MKILLEKDNIVVDTVTILLLEFNDVAVKIQFVN